jgi:hypothetical protein
VLFADQTAFDETIPLLRCFGTGQQGGAREWSDRRGSGLTLTDQKFSGTPERDVIDLMKTCRASRAVTINVP